MENASSYKISMLQVKNGECFFLEFISDGKPFNIMVDCGPSWKKLKQHLEKIDLNLKIDLLILTHVDDDHLNGALGLLKDEEYKNRISQIWHNGLEQIAPLWWKDSDTPKNKDRLFKALRDKCEDRLRELNPKDGYISASKSISFSVDLRNARIPVNTVAITSQTASKKVGNNEDIIIDFLLPNEDTITMLLNEFSCALGKMIDNPKLTDVALQAYDAFIRMPIQANHDGHISSKTRREVDDSLTNATSIAIIIRFNGKKFLFPGDAVDTELIPALRNWKADNEGENLIFDVVKLPHHGSTRNCFELLNMPDFGSRIYLISTDGSVHRHPDEKTIEQLKKKCASENSLVYFNYHNVLERFDCPKGSLSPAFLVKTEITDRSDNIL